MNDEHSLVVVRANNTRRQRKRISLFVVTLCGLFFISEKSDRLKHFKEYYGKCAAKGNRITKHHFLNQIAMLLFIMHTYTHWGSFLLTLFGFLSNDYAKWSLL